MRAPISRLTLILPLLLLAGCASGLQQIAPPVAAVRTTAPAADARRAEIKRQIAKVCPAVLTPAELDRFAAMVERLAGDEDVVAVVKRLFRFDSEARVCRGGAPQYVS